MMRRRISDVSPAVSDAELQADVMRFVAILALCLVAVSSLVDGYRDAPAPVPEEVQTSPRIPETASPAPPLPPVRRVRSDEEPAPVTPGGPPDMKADRRPEPEPQAPEPADAGSPSLRFLTDAALLRLVARGEAGVFVLNEGEVLALDLSAGIDFRSADSPSRFYTMAAETVPALLKASYPGPEGAIWGVTLPERTARSIEQHLAAGPAGNLVIDAHGRVSLERFDD